MTAFYGLRPRSGCCNCGLDVATAVLICISDVKTLSTILSKLMVTANDDDSQQRGRGN